VTKEVQIYVKAVRRKEPDLRKLARALIQLALAEEVAAASLPSSDEGPPTEAAS